MALIKFNSLAGFSTGANAVAVIDANANVYANVLSTVGNANIGGNINLIGDLNVANIYGNVFNGNLLNIGDLTVSANSITTTSGNIITIDPAPTGNAGTVVIQGDLDVQGNVTYINSNVIVINDKTINLANNAATSTAANGSGLEVGPLGNTYATWLYSSSANSWVSSIAIVATGGANINGQLTGATDIIASGNANVTGNINTDGNLVVVGWANVTGNIHGSNNITIDGYANITGDIHTSGNISSNGYANITGYIHTSDNLSADGYANITGYIHSSNNITADGYANITGDVTAANFITAGNVTVTQNISGDLITVNTANVGVINVASAGVTTATVTTTTSTANTVLYSTVVGSINTFNFMIASYDGATTTSYTTSLQGDSNLNWSIYGSTGVPLGDLTLVANSGNVDLVVTPYSSNSTIWKVFVNVI